MARLTLTAREVTWLVGVLEAGGGGRERDAVLAKLEKAQLPVKRAPFTVSVQEAMGAFREALGDRLIAPPPLARGVFARMTQRLTALGLTRGDCLVIAKTAAVEWQGPVRAESLVRQADKLLAAAQGRFSWMSDGKRDTSPVELADDDI